MTKFTEKTERIFNRALEIIKHTEIPNDYFIEANHFPFPSDMFHLIGLMSDSFRSTNGDFILREDFYNKFKQWIEENSDSISSSDVILEAKTEYEALYYYMAKVIGNIESGHMKVRKLR